MRGRGEGGASTCKIREDLHPIERNLAIARVTPASFASFRDKLDLLTNSPQLGEGKDGSYVRQLLD